MARRTTKVRENDWRSIEKAINGLESSLGESAASPTFNGLNVTNNITVNNNQITNFTLHKVADEAARLALTKVTGKLVYQIDNGYAYLCTTT